jgi:hypothetical protein
MAPNVDLEVPPDLEVTSTTATNIDGDIAAASVDFTLSEEGEGDIINGNKELRTEGDDEDETNSKRPKVPLTGDEPAE